jgi:hypothetical protein
VKNIGEKYWGWDLHKKNWTTLRINFSFQYKDFTDLLYGFQIKKPSKNLVNYFKKLKPGHTTKAWALWEWPDPDEFAYWNEEIFSMFLNKNNDLVVFIDDKIKELLKIVQNRKDL